MSADRIGSKRSFSSGDQRPGEGRLEYTQEHREMDLMALTGNESPEALHEALRSLKNSLEKMDFFGTGTNWIALEKSGDEWVELTRAPRDDEHKAELIAKLGALGIYPWEEIQENVPVLVIEHPRDVQILRTAGIIVYIFEMHERKEARAREDEMLRRAQEAIERNARIAQYISDLRRTLDEERQAMRTPVPASFGADAFYQFPYPKLIFPRDNRARRAVARTEPTEGVLELDDEIQALVEAWDSGASEDVEEARKVFESKVPTLTLFPRKFRWIRNGSHKVVQMIGPRGEAGKIYSTEEYDTLLESARNWRNNKESLEALETLIEMHVGLLLWLLPFVQARIDAEPDILFQNGLLGLIYAIEKYDPNRGSGGGFVPYAITRMEGFMRLATRGGSIGSVIHVPVHVVSERNKVRRAERALRQEHPERKIGAEEVRQTLENQGIKAGKNLCAFDAFLRKLMLNYELTAIDELLSEEGDATRVDMRGLPLQQEPDESGAFLHDAKRLLRKLLLSLTPREERIVRLYFGLAAGARDSDSKYETTAKSEEIAQYAFRGDEIKTILREHAGRKSIVGIGPHTRAMRQFAGKSLDFQKRLVRAVLKAYANATREYDTEGGGESFKEIAHQQGMTPERIRQILAKALRKMRHPSRNRHLLTLVT